MNVVYLNTKGDSTTVFNVPMLLPGFECAIFEMSGKLNSPVNTALFLCTDICEESSLGYNRLPILRYLNPTKNGLINKPIDNVIWLNVTRPIIGNIRLYICDKNGKIISLTKSNLNCTLVFRKKKEYDSG